MATRVMLVDDHLIFREGLRTLLEMEGEYQVVAEASTAGEALNKASVWKPDIILMDVSLPDADGISVVRKLKESNPEMNAVMLTMHMDDRYVLESVSAGAAAYLVKTATYEEIKRALRDVQAGRAVLSPSVGRAVFSKVSSLTQTPVRQRLTQREREILGHLREGMSNREIAQTLFLSESTVKTHLKALYHKLGVKNRTQAVKKALEPDGLA